MKLTLLFFLGLAVGWVSNSALVKAGRGENWKPDAKWAAFGLFDIVAVLVLFPLVFP